MSWSGELPFHIGIILDGNRRWADSRGISRKDAIYHGLAKVEEIMFDWSRRFREEFNVAPFKQITIYALTLNNIQKRPKEELDEIYNSFLEEVSRVKSRGEFDRYKIRVKFGGKLSSLPQNLVEALSEVEELTKNHDAYHFFIPIAYDGNEEIRDAFANAILHKNRLEDNLCFPEAKPIDMLIRTGGEMRLSGFMSWYVGQSELFFTETLAEDFTYEEFISMLKKFSLRERRFGR